MERIERDDPRCTVSIKLRSEPNREIPKTDKELPNRQKLRKLILDPRLKQSKTDKVDASFEIPKTLKEDPILM
jgi:hypothetical protein